MKWHDIEAVIPAVMSIPDRADSVKDLLIQLAQQCPGITAKVVPQWRDKLEPREAFISISTGLKNLSTSWVLYLEDDCLLSSKFGELVLKDLEDVSEDWGAISYMSSAPQDERINGTAFYRAGYPFILSQCVLIKSNLAREWGEHLIEWWDAAPEGKRRAPDMALGDAAMELGEKIMVRIPNLAQHKVIQSAFGHSQTMMSKTFLP